MEDRLTFDDAVLIAGGHTAFQLLWAGVNLGVFNLLSREPDLSEEEIAEKIGLEKQPARILLRGLTGLRLIVKNHNSFRNSRVAGELFTSDSPTNWVDVLGWQYHIVYPGEMDFLESLRQSTNVGLRHFPGDEPDLYSRLSHDSELERIFHNAMSSLSSSANAILIDKVDFGHISHLVDAGGGDGTNAIALARANPHLKITIFDALSVCERAKQNISEAGLTDRIHTHPGNFFIDDFPEGIDAILFAHMLTIWSPDKNTALLQRAYEALPSTGEVIIFNMMAYDDGSGPMTATLGSPYFLTIATGEGMLYSWSDYEGFLSAAGFKQTQRHQLPKDHGVLIGVK